MSKRSVNAHMSLGTIKPDLWPCLGDTHVPVCRYACHMDRSTGLCIYMYMTEHQVVLMRESLYVYDTHTGMVCVHDHAYKVSSHLGTCLGSNWGMRVVSHSMSMTAECAQAGT